LAVVVRWVTATKLCASIVRNVATAASLAA